jgi:hypothetical protein
MPIAASRPRKMIWATAKSTEVSSRHRPSPRRATGFGSTVLGATQSTAGVAMPGS